MAVIYLAAMGEGDLGGGIERQWMIKMTPMQAI